MGDRKERQKKSAINAGLAGSQAETVQRYGSAVKQHFVAHSGVDNETGQKLAKGLDEIAKSKVNSQFSDSNIKQQAGFSAEVKTAARESAEKIIHGNSKTRVVRTDDIAKQTTAKGHTIGGRNDQLFDIAEVDSNGAYIEGTARQLKYVGGTASDCAKKLLGQKFDKYREADVPVEIPADFYDDVNRELTQKSQDVRRHIESAENRGDYALADKHRSRLKKIEDTQRNLRKGKLTNDEAIQARLHPSLSTAKDITNISHRAGLQGLKTGAAIGGGISVIQNTVAVINGDKEPAEALIGVVSDTTKAAATSYATNFVGSAVKGAMQNAPSQYLQSLSKTNLPATIVVSALEIGKTLSRYGSGEIDGVQCLTELGEKGTGMLASSAGAAVGQALIPIPVVGALVGSMVGYAMSTAYYNSVLTALNEAKMAHEDRLRIEAECKIAIAAMQEYRLRIELATGNYMREHIAVFRSAFEEMEIAYYSGDSNGFVAGTNRITRKLGGTPLFENQAECDALMKSDAVILL